MKREVIDIRDEKRQLGAWGRRAAGIALVVGVLSLAASIAIAAAGGGIARFLQSYLVNFAFLLSLCLGALFFVLIQHLTGATWSVVIRRLGEALAANLPLLALMALPVIFGMKHLYHWSDGQAVAHDALLQWKRPYLNPAFFIIRLAVYFVLWSWLAFYYHRRSVAQDASGDPQLTRRMQRLSAPAMVIFALTVTFAAFDLLMSIDPHWFSTIFGVYFFSGCVVASFAFLTLQAQRFQKAGFLARAITREHYHDLGKMIFAFIVFWAYIAFSQYMLIWYANIPEETSWYLARQTGGWTTVSVLLIFGHFFVPFLGLISRYPKRQGFLLVPGCLWVLLMHWLDLYWLVMPEFSAGRVPFHVLDLSVFLGLGGLFAAVLLRRLARHSLIAEQDPRLPESLVFENA